MFEYKIIFKGDSDEKPIEAKSGFPTFETAKMWAEIAVEGVAETFEKYDPDNTYTEEDFKISITGTEDLSMDIFFYDGILVTGRKGKKLKLLKELADMIFWENDNNYQ